MSRTIRFHLDENCPKAIANGLRYYGVVVSTTPEAGLIGAIDEIQVAYCLEHGYVLITQDQDFLRLNAAGIPHSGIAYCVKDTKSIGEIVRSALLIWEVLEPEEIRQKIEHM